MKSIELLENRILNGVILVLALVVACSLSVTCGWAAELDWKDEFRARRSEIQWDGKSCERYVALARECWERAGSPGKGWRVVVRIGRFRRHALFVVDEPGPLLRFRRGRGKPVRWCVSDVSLYEIPRDEPVERAWSYDGGLDGSLNFGW